MHDDTDSQTKEGVQFAHPLGVAFCQVIVDRDNVNAKPCERVEIDGKGRNQRLSFTGLHLGNVALMQNNATDKLDVEVPNHKNAATRLTNYGKGFRQNFVERFLQNTLISLTEGRAGIRGFVLNLG